MAHALQVKPFQQTQRLAQKGSLGPGAALGDDAGILGAARLAFENDSAVSV